MGPYELSGKRIFLIQQRKWAPRIGHFLAKELQADGCVLGALTWKRATHNFIVSQKEVKYDFIINYDEIADDPEKYLAGEKYNFSKICADLGIDSLWPLISASRSLAKSYKDKYYYSFRQNIPDEEIEKQAAAYYKAIKAIFEEFRPDAIISANYADLFHIMLNLFGEQRKVPMLALVSPRIGKNLYVFTTHYKEDTGEFFQRVDQLNAKRVETENRRRAQAVIKEFRADFIPPVYAQDGGQKRSWWKKLRSEIAPYYHALRWRVQSANRMKSLGPSIDYRPPLMILRDHYARKRYRRYMEKFPYYDFSKIGKFVYYPLQVQPEATIDVTAPYFSNQIEAARLIAMSLPDDYTLVVKEHPAMVGMRPPSYIEKIYRTPNVKLIDFRVPSPEILKRASLVVSPNGTVVAEASFYSKPAIQLGDLGTALRLPNVWHHTDMTTIGVLVKKLLRENLQNAEYDRKLENYIAAAYDTGVEFNYWAAWEKGNLADYQPLWKAYKKELGKLLTAGKK